MERPAIALDKRAQTIGEMKKLPKEEFLQYPGMTEDIYDALQNAQSGFIKIKHADTNICNEGHTEAFGEGLSCYMYTISRWYMTSTIQKINWEEKYFDTLNSRYYFDFIPYENEEQQTSDTGSESNA